MVDFKFGLADALAAALNDLRAREAEIERLTAALEGTKRGFGKYWAEQAAEQNARAIAAEAALETVRTRLECNYVFRLNKETHELERIETDLPEHMDGIACRDETIKLLQEGNDKLRTALEEANKERATARHFMEHLRHEIDATARREEREACELAIEKAFAKSDYSWHKQRALAAIRARSDNSGHQTDGFVKPDEAAIRREEREACAEREPTPAMILAGVKAMERYVENVSRGAVRSIFRDMVRARTDGKPGT